MQGLKEVREMMEMKGMKEVKEKNSKKEVQRMKDRCPQGEKSD